MESEMESDSKLKERIPKAERPTAEPRQDHFPMIEGLARDIEPGGKTRERYSETGDMK